MIDVVGVGLLVGWFGCLFWCFGLGVGMFGLSCLGCLEFVWIGCVVCGYCGFWVD